MSFECSSKQIKISIQSLYSEWSGYSSDIVTYPPAPTGINAVIVGVDGTDVRVSWNASPTATSYEIAYTNDPSLFGQSDGVSTVSTSDKSTSYTFANNSTLALGKTWYFQVRAKNSGGESPYSGYTGLTIGKKPSAPTTWSSATKVGVGETPILYWVHNATDGSSQTWAQIMVTVNGSSKTLTWQNTRVGDERDATVEYKLDVSDYAEGSKIYWKVRTKGAMTADQYWSDWSEERTIDIYPNYSHALQYWNNNTLLASYNGNTPCLWDGGAWMFASQSVTLNAPISEQPHGIIVIFALFDPTTNSLTNVMTNPFFVPKSAINYDYIFTMFWENAWQMCTKRVTIQNTCIIGNDQNKSAAFKANTGITTSPQYFVLRRVYGV